MSSKTIPKLVFGGVNVTGPEGPSLLDALEGLGITTIDAAAAFSEAEIILGEANAASRYTIDTKFQAGIGPEPSTKEKVIEIGKQSLQRLNTDCVDVFYPHAPDNRVPLEEMLAGVNELYKSGAFKRFGLSNFTPEGVEEVIRVAKEHNFVLPTVYQGSYNAFSRLTETELLPLLRKHGIAFYAYSPSAGGFLAKRSEYFRGGEASGRWDASTLYGEMNRILYAKDAMLDGLDVWNETAKKEGVSGIEMALRWITHHSALDGNLGDGVIVGARTVGQLQEMVSWVNKGTLSPGAVQSTSQIWDSIASEAVLDNYNHNSGERFLKILQGTGVEKMLV